MTKAILRNKQTNDLYEHIEGGTFQNLRTIVTGNVSDEVASKIFIINIPMTEIINEYPDVKLLIEKLNLKYSL